MASFAVRRFGFAATFALAGLVAWACSSEENTSPVTPQPSAPPTPSPDDSGASSSGSSGQMDAYSTDGAMPARGVVIREGQLIVDGVPTFLFGGEVQYFRVRDAAFDGQKTQALWKDTFARMRAANMNLVTTYFAWDYHETEPGKWDFTGARDADAYLTAACNQGLKVIAKPGPLITAEWPRGFGSFGAIPDFWKEANQAALAKKADGSNFDFSSLPGSPKSLQPSYLHPTYLKAVEGWFDKIVPIIRKHIDSRCVIAVQVDNETNLYWSERYGNVDYNPVSLAHYRDGLSTKYGNIAALNQKYGSRYGAFSDVDPPKQAPNRSSENVAARDWYDAGQNYIGSYLAKIREFLEARGIREPDVLMMTNDSPFTIVGTVVNEARNTMVHDGRVKNRFGLAGLDLYPKQIPDLPGGSGQLTNFPYQVDYATAQYSFFSPVYTKDARYKYAFGAELQGGFYSFPTGVLPVVSPEATAQLLTKSVGHGLKGGSFYILRGGLNADGSTYDFQAALGLNGEERPRFGVMRSFGEFFSAHGGALMRAEPAYDPVAVVQDIRYAAPQGGTDDNHQLMYTNEYPALMGWLIDSGFHPHVVDIGGIDGKGLKLDASAYKAALYLAPQIVADDAARAFVEYHRSGGMLVQFLDRGQRNLDMAASADVTALADLFPVELDGSYTWPRVPRTVGSGELNDPLSGQPLRSYWYQNYWKPKPGADVDTLLWERRAVIGTNGKPVAVMVNSPGAPRALFGTYLSSVYSTDNYYSDDAASLLRRRAVLRQTLQRAGIVPRVFAEDARASAWARKVPANRQVGDEPVAFVFVVNDGDAREIKVRVSADALGLVPNDTYEIQTAIGSKITLVSARASVISEGAIKVSLPKNGSQVLIVRKAK
jgi:hypothetical protein